MAIGPDVLVVGAGLAGVSVAWWLRGQRVWVVDQASQVGAEASSQNAGMVRRMGEDPIERTLALRTHRWLTEPPSESLADPAISQRTGAVLALADDPHHLHDAASALLARGVDVSQISAADLPRVAPALANSPIQTAWWMPEERVADAHLLLGAMLADLRQRAEATSLRLSTSVDRLLVDQGRVVGAVLDGVPVYAGAVVIAAGAWSARLAASAGLVRPLVPLRRSLVHLVTKQSPSAHHPWCWVDDVGVYIRPEGGGWLASGCDEAVSVPEGFASRGPVSEELRARTVDKVERFFPGIGPVSARGGWTGLRTFAPDRRPVLGADPERSGLWWCAGLGGFGVTCGLAAGELVADWLTGRACDWFRDPEEVSPGRPFPRRWPIRPDGDVARQRLVSVARQRASGVARPSLVG